MNPSNFRESFTGSSHGFDPGLAKALESVEAAILYSDLAFWLSINANSTSVFKEGKIWSFSTHEQIAKRLGYMNKRQVGYAMDKLVKAGLVIKGNFNQNTFDKTAWYTLADIKIQPKLNNPYERQNCNIEETKLQHRGNEIATSHIEDDISLTEKQQQQQRKEPAAPVVVFPALEDTRLTPKQKIDLSKKYGLCDVNLAVSRMHRMKDRKSDMATLLWLLENPDEWQEPIANDATSNKELARKVEKALIAQGQSFIDAYPDCVCLDRGNPIQKNMLSYDAKGFRDQFDSALRKKNTSLKELKL